MRPGPTQRRTAIVTGGSRGIGRAITERLASDDLNVVCCARSPRQLQETVAELRSAGLQVEGMAANVADRTDVDGLVGRALEWTGRLDVLVNNAGIYAPAPFLELSAETWRQTMEVNLTGTLLCSQAAARAMIDSRSPSGRIINVASTNAFASEPKSADYNASKAAVVSLTRSMAVDLAPEGILVTCVSPGWIDTDIDSSGYLAGLSPDEMGELNPLGRLGDVKEVAGVVSFLSGPDASFVNGSTIHVDGGQLASSPKPI